MPEVCRVMGIVARMLGIRRVDRRPEWRERLEGAATRLNALGLYPRPFTLARVAVVVWPGFFAVPGMRGFVGFAAWRLVILRRDVVGDGLLVHELCHIWQMRHHPVRMPLTYLVVPYRTNPWEEEARMAAGEPSRLGGSGG